MDTINPIPNPELTVCDDNKSYWTHADHRRYGWHNLHRIARYCTSFRSARVMPLEKRMDLRIAHLETVRHYTGLPWFSAMVVIRGSHILFERYAPDFSPSSPHSIQSITKTTMNLIVGQLLDSGVIDLSRTVRHYIPEIGSGYADATVQEVLNMDVSNEYTEDFADPQATYYRHEEAMGWRLPLNPECEETQRRFIASIKGSGTSNSSGQVQYKDANTQVAGWIVERVSGHPLRSFLADIVDAAGLEAALHITTDREATPTVEGGACMTARDLARYFSLFIRGGRGILGERVGSEAFIKQTLVSGLQMPQPFEWLRYSNQMMTDGQRLGHAGWGGQYAVANLRTGAVAVFFSVLENQHATNRDYLAPVIQMLESVTNMPW